MLTRKVVITADQLIHGAGKFLESLVTDLMANVIKVWQQSASPKGTFTITVTFEPEGVDNGDIRKTK